MAAGKYIVQYENNVDVGLARAHIIAKNGSGYYDERGTAIVFVKAISTKGKAINSTSTTFKIEKREP